MCSSDLFKAWFEKGGSSKKKKKDNDGKPKRPKKVTKTDASCVRNLDIELVHQNFVRLWKGRSILMLPCMLFLVVYAFFSL